MANPFAGLKYDAPVDSLAGLKYEAPAEPEPYQYSPLHTVALNATNVFGLGPAVTGLVGKIQGEGYAENRDRYQAEIDEANAQNPRAALVGKGLALVPETIAGGAAGKLVAGGARLALGGSKVFSTALRLGESSPTLAAAAKGAISGAGYGAAASTGEALSRGQDVLPAALEGAGGGALGGAALGAIAHQAGKAFRGAGAKEEADLLRGVAQGEGEAGSAGVKVKKRLDAQKREILTTLREDPELFKASRKPAAEAEGVFKSKLETLGSQLDPLYKRVDNATGGVSVRGLVDHLNKEIKVRSQDPLNEVYANGLAKIRDSVQQSWAPHFAEAEKTIAELQAQGIKRIPANLVPADVRVPAQDLRKVVTQLQTRATDVLGGLNPGESAKAKQKFATVVKDYLDSHLDAAGTKDAAVKDAVAAIREVNKRYSSVSTMLSAIQQRGWKESTGSISGRGLASDLLKKGSMMGAAVTALHGHPLAALGTLAAHQAVEHLPDVVRGGNAKLAALARAADAGNPNAVRLLAGIKQGYSFGQAGAGRVGAAVTTTMGAEDQP